MENLRFNIAAGETKTFERGGRYLEIIDATGPVSIILSDQNGGRADSAKDVLSGTYMATAFAKFEVFSATAQIVELFLSDTSGGTKRQPGSVRVIDEISDSIEQVAGQTNTAITAFAAQELVAPGVNVNGMLIRFASCSATAGAGGEASVRIVAAKATPTGYSVPTKRYQLVEFFTAAQAEGANTVRPNKRLPPGWGVYVLWEIRTTVAPRAPSYAVQYEV